MAAEDPRRLLAERPLSGLQIGIIAVLFCLNGLDGFDVLTISFAAPGIVQQWGITPDALGVVISIGLAATGAGSLFLAPLADRFGRRPLIAISLAAMTTGMLLCTAAAGLPVLSGGRLLTGLGVGIVVPCISALAAEFANRRFRELAVVLVAIGFPAGGLLGGALSSALLAHFDWRAVFAAGAVTTGVLAVAAYVFLPESIEFLLVHRSDSALARLNRVLVRLRHPPLAALPDPDPQRQRASLADLVRQPALLGITLLVTLIYALHNATTYYALNWIPKIAVDHGLSQAQAAAVGSLCSGGGIVGALIAAALSVRIDIRPVAGAFLAAAAVLLWLLALTPGQLPLLMAASAALGAGLYGGQASLYALMTRQFPVEVRATGVGFVTGAGRVGGIVAPLIAGQLLGSGLNYAQVSPLMALGSLGGAIALLAVGRRRAAS